MKFRFLNILLGVVVGSAVATWGAAQETRPAPMNGPWFGVLQAKPQHMDQNYNAGIRMVTLEIGWNQYEPQPGAFQREYSLQMKKRLEAYRKAGMQVVLDLGLQYPPAWIFDLPHSRFINQYGEAYAENPEAGCNGVNAVFNQALRDLQATYILQVLADLGTDFYAIRLGGGYYGELGYPTHNYKGRENCYWAFDPLAQGQRLGLPVDMKPCPVPGWSPGAPGDDHTSAKMFAHWYMDCLRNYHDWQIATVRRLYSGRLMMLYPSFGIRPGQLDKAIAGNLNGTTSAEKNGEIPRGFDFGTFINGITDPDVVLYTTWLDFDSPYLKDELSNPVDWSPIHYLASLAAAHRPRLEISGENTGHNDLAAMRRSVERMRKYGLSGMFWAFEGELYDGKYATITDYALFIARRDPPLPPKMGR